MIKKGWIKHIASCCSVALCIFVKAAMAQLPVETIERPSVEAVRDAFSTEYGQLLVKEFGKILWKSANPECLRAAHMDQASVEERGRQILIINGARLIERSMRLLNVGKVEIEFAAHAGSTANEELVSLRHDADVKTVIELQEAVRMARLVNLVSEHLDRYALISRLGLVSALSPYISANPELLDADPEYAALEAVERFIKSKNSQNLRRWMELSEMRRNSQFKVISDSREFLSLGPKQLLDGLEEDLINSCVFPRR